MTTEVAGTDAWLKEIGAQARTSTARVFSVSVPLNHPDSPDQAPEHLVAATIEGVEVHGWQLESMSTYGAAFTLPPYEPDPRFWALLVFRTTYRGRNV
ncbi:hypothetical protein ACIQJT_40810 [Streptomyces sp. NPDC091972]|uniref:hypothetical protein n=1 Tax=Streptomyces sp. NPDC091972 TaxID=3366007 RepID=UPI00382FA10C